MPEVILHIWPDFQPDTVRSHTKISGRVGQITLAILHLAVSRPGARPRVIASLFAKQRTTFVCVFSFSVIHRILWIPRPLPTPTNPENVSYIPKPIFLEDSKVGDLGPSSCGRNPTVNESQPRVVKTMQFEGSSTYVSTVNTYAFLIFIAMVLFVYNLLIFKEIRACAKMCTPVQRG